ncbi:MAG TPA: DUF5661 family protein [Candidatus Limnocylindrales bacterium]|nr:DUF5661 family protein [Candidatus Limnocylindrales bacterium]
MASKRQFTTEDATRIGGALGIDFAEIRIDEFRAGLGVELEHGARDPDTNITNDDELLTGKIAHAHLREFPDYYTRLAELEKDANAFWAKKQ